MSQPRSPACCCANLVSRSCTLLSMPLRFTSARAWFSPCFAHSARLALALLSALRVRRILVALSYLPAWYGDRPSTKSAVIFFTHAKRHIGFPALTVASSPATLFLSASSFSLSLSFSVASSAPSCSTSRTKSAKSDGNFNRCRAARRVKGFVASHCVHRASSVVEIILLPNSLLLRSQIATAKGNDAQVSNFTTRSTASLSSSI
mmetsp:Transcript_64514/g.127556  ORF Transcript_64514/g.127556 Transcript_64514/m.127556 type:complete len:205 (-) Transcript_64514:723-1337(-)